MDIQPFNPLDIVYTPTEIVNIGTAYLENRRHNKGMDIPLGLPSIDKDLNPLVAGDLVTVIGRPGNGKTGFMMRWARARAEYLRTQQLENRVVVYATWEQSIEELYAFSLAADTRISITSMSRGEITDDEMSIALGAGMKRIGLPLWFIGHSIARRKKRPRITVKALWNGLEQVEGWNNDRTQIDMVFVDYLQRIPFEGKVESKTIGTSDNLDRLKDAALAFGCPVVAGVQSTRDVDKKMPLPIPQMDDGQWASNIEQASDKVFSVVRPRKYRQEGEMFGTTLVQGHNQMLVSLLKQKLGKDNLAFWVTFDPAYNRLDEAEVRYYNLNGGE